MPAYAKGTASSRSAQEQLVLKRATKTNHQINAMNKPSHMYAGLFMNVSELNDAAKTQKVCDEQLFTMPDGTALRLMEATVEINTGVTVPTTAGSDKRHLSIRLASYEFDGNNDRRPMLLGSPAMLQKSTFMLRCDARDGALCSGAMLLCCALCSSYAQSIFGRHAPNSPKVSSLL